MGLFSRKSTAKPADKSDEITQTRVADARAGRMQPHPGMVEESPGGRTIVDIKNQNPEGTERKERMRMAFGEEIEINRTEWYRIEENIGVGGMGAVYCAAHVLLVDENMDEDAGHVAIKFIVPKEGQDSEEVQKQFVKEMKALISLNHPNIVKVTTYGFHKGRPYYVMELLKREDDESLKNNKELKDEIIENGGMLSWERTREIGLQICSGLSAAHKKGIFHHDVKPANIFLVDVDGDKVVKILDFGLVRHVWEDEDDDDIIRGTPNYLAPEQFRKKPTDHRTDIYSTGVVLYEMLTGTVPFSLSSESELVVFGKALCFQDPDMSILEQDKTIPREVVAAIRKCLMKEPDDRFQDILELREILKNAGVRQNSGQTSGDTPSNPPAQAAMPVETPGQKLPGSRFRNAAIGIAVVTGVLIGGAALGLSFVDTNRNTHPQTNAGRPPVSAKLDLEPAKPMPQPTKAPAVELPAQVQQADAGAEAPPQKTQHTLRIMANVAGAGIYMNGEKVGQTGADGSAELMLDEASEPVRITLRKRGYGSALVQITPDRDLERTVRMEEERERAKATPGKQSRFGFNPTKR